MAGNAWHGWKWLGMAGNCWNGWTWLEMAGDCGTYCKSRSEQAPGSEFHPRDESEKNDCGFLGPSWCNKKVNPVIHVVHMNNFLSNVAHQMKEKLTINDFSHFLSQISLKFEMCSIFSGSKQPE